MAPWDTLPANVIYTTYSEDKYTNGSWVSIPPGGGGCTWICRGFIDRYDTPPASRWWFRGEDFTLVEDGWISCTFKVRAVSQVFSFCCQVNYTDVQATLINNCLPSGSAGEPVRLRVEYLIKYCLDTSVTTTCACNLSCGNVIFCVFKRDSRETLSFTGKAYKKRTKDCLEHHLRNQLNRSRSRRWIVAQDNNSSIQQAGGWVDPGTMAAITFNGYYIVGGWVLSESDTKNDS